MDPVVNLDTILVCVGMVLIAGATFRATRSMTKRCRPGRQAQSDGMM
jgi:hypothetical protein